MMIGKAARRVSLVAMAVGGLALAAPGVAGANPTCGSTVTHSVKLTADMSCPVSSGILVGKSGITINLNGHTITGPSTGTYYGVYDSGYARVTIENGTVQNFYDGVDVEYSSQSKIVNIKAHGAQAAGIAYQYSLDGSIDHSAASHNADEGIYLYENTNVNATNSTATHNSTYGFYDYYSAATLNHNTANDNSNYGIFLEYPAAYTSLGPYVVKNSTANGNGIAGVYVTNNTPQWQYQADLIANTANNNTDFGFYASAWALGSHNHASGNGSQNCFRVRGCS
jgi:parallel beta-helix repeat protein